MDNQMAQIECLQFFDAELMIRWEIDHPPIEILNLDISHIGQDVMYLPKRMNLEDRVIAREHGVITSYNAHFVFVCFDKSGRGQACLPDDLTFNCLV
jgi:hypothetical protein